jgi:hypothetical protein
LRWQVSKVNLDDMLSKSLPRRVSPAGKRDRGQAIVASAAARPAVHGQGIAAELPGQHPERDQLAAMKFSCHYWVDP